MAEKHNGLWWEYSSAKGRVAGYLHTISLYLDMGPNGRYVYTCSLHGLNARPTKEEKESLRSGALTNLAKDKTIHIQGMPKKDSTGHKSIITKPFWSSPSPKIRAFAGSNDESDLIWNPFLPHRPKIGGAKSDHSEGENSDNIKLKIDVANLFSLNSQWVNYTVVVKTLINKGLFE